MKNYIIKLLVINTNEVITITLNAYSFKELNFNSNELRILSIIVKPAIIEF